MQMEQHVGLILSIILHLCASSKHNRVKRTCSARTLAFKTKASYVHMCQCSKEFIHFPEMEQSGQKRRNRKWRTLKVLLHTSHWSDICLLLKDNVFLLISWHQSIFLMRFYIPERGPTACHCEAWSCLRRQNQAG